MPLHEVMLGLGCQCAAAEEEGEGGIGSRELENQCVIVRRFQDHRFAIHEAAGRRYGRVLFVEPHILPQEENVLGSERFAVGPFHALAQIDRELGGVTVPFEALRQVRFPAARRQSGAESVQVGGDVDKTAVDDVAGCGAVGLVEGEAANRFAVSSDFMDGGDDARVDRQAIIDRWQVTGIHHCFEHWRFVVLRRGLCSRRLGFCGRFRGRLIGGRFRVVCATCRQQCACRHSRG